MALTVLVATALIALAIASCSDAGTAPAAALPAGGLTSSLPAVTVTAGQTVDVNIAGGVAPYAVKIPPNPGLARAVWGDSSHTPARLTIIGVVTVATGSTSVRVKDSSPSPEKEVEIPVTKK
jgi:hypothetical protein